LPGGNSGGLFGSSTFRPNFDRTYRECTGSFDCFIASGLHVKKFIVLAFLGVSCAYVGPALAQDASRIDKLENQIRQLTGQIEELSFSVQQLQKQLKQDQQLGQAEPALPAPQQRVKLQQQATTADSGVEVIEEAPLVAQKPADDAELVASTESAGLPKGAKILGSMASAAAKGQDGGFEGQVLVPLGADENQPVTGQSEGIEQVVLQPETPQSLFEQSNEALLRRQFTEAASGFQKLLQTYPDHSLAGSAQYWLGETYYAQGDYRMAAQNFLTGYQKYPKSRRAPDSLLKLGLSLNKMGQKDQACASFVSIAAEYPKAAEAKKRAQTELKRAGC
jgi:tol-pal system protein YbgF